METQTQRREYVPSDKELEITQRVQKLIDQSGLSVNETGKKIGLLNLNRVLHGKRGWKILYLERIAALFGVSFEDLSGGPIKVSIQGELSALAKFPYVEKIDPQKELGVTDYVIGGGNAQMVAGMYALRLSDRSLLPAMGPGTILFLEKDVKIEDGEVAVCPDDFGQARICRIFLSSDTTITLKSLNPLLPDEILPRHRLKTCDKVVLVRLK